ncbi:MAG: formate dehydrogenase accessory sulfurtransferase FdhD [Bacteroidia bacterium]
MSRPSVTSVSVKKINGAQAHHTDDLLAAEEPLEIRIGFGARHEREQKTISVTMRTPGNDFALAAGFLFTEGIIRKATDIVSVAYCEGSNSSENNGNRVRVELQEEVSVDIPLLERNFYTTSSCGICGKTSIDAIRTLCPPYPDDTLTISKNIIHSLPGKLLAHQTIFKHTGGLHSCAFFDPYGDLLLQTEDIGRHNALDKLIGTVLLSGKINLSEGILLLSGRASFELIQKSAMAGIHIVAAIGAPSSLAVETASAFGISLIGFLREERFNIYTGDKRISDREQI